MSTLRKLTAVVVATTLAASASVATAMPFADGLALKNAAPASTETVRWGRGWGWGLGAGLAAGAIIGGGLAAPRYYYGPGPYYYGPGPYYGPAPVYADPGYADPGGSDPVAYCSARFKSYDPRSGTYLGYDGQRHPCP